MRYMIGRLRCAWALALGLLVATSPPASAQVETGPPPGGVRPGRGIPEELVPPPEPDPAAPVPIPTPRIEPAPERDLRGLRFLVRGYRFVGNTVFPTEELQELAAPYAGRGITSDELDELRVALTRKYVDAGYINSGAVIPDQTLEDGIVTIQIVEGRLDEIRIEGVDSLTPEFVRDRLRLGSGPPLNVNDLQSRLQLLLQTPFIDRINADIQPGLRPGEADLVARIEERDPYRLQFVVDNNISPAIGPARARALGELHNLTGKGDIFRTEIAMFEGGADFFGQYIRPLNARDTTLNVFGENIFSDVVEEPFDQIDVESHNWSIGAGLTHPFFRTPRRELLVGLNFERRGSSASLLGRPFQSAPGVTTNGNSDVSVFRLVKSYLDRSPNQVLAFRSTASLGVDILGATDNDGGLPDGQFLAWLGQAQWSLRFPGDGGQLIVRGDLQLTNDPLLPIEQFALGGPTTVRGYRKNLLVRDWGYAASVEYRMPFLRDQVGRPRIQIAAFVDFGGAFFLDRASPKPRSIASIGLGLHFDPHPKFHGELYWGFGDTSVRRADEDIQDEGIHFLVNARLFD